MEHNAFVHAAVAGGSSRIPRPGIHGVVGHHLIVVRRLISDLSCVYHRRQAKPIYV